jgi:hypothetical protein
MAETEDKKKKKSRGFATPVLVRKDDGRLGLIYVDVKTGREVDPESYEVVDQYTANLIELGLEPDPSKEDKKKDEKKKEEDERDLFRDGGDGEYHSDFKGDGKGFARNVSNNFGYRKKPGALGLLGMVPNPMAQFANKAIDYGFKANNKIAADEARNMLGIENDKGLKGLAGYVKDNKGYIGDVSYNGVTSPVGFEAEDKLGRTTLTPNEARMRQQLSENFRPAEGVEKAQSIAQFQSENPESIPSKARDFAGTVAKGAVKGALLGAIGGDVMGGLLGSLVNSVKGYGINIAKDAISDVVTNALDKPDPVSDQAVFGDQKPNRGLGDLSPTFAEKNIDTGINYSHPDRGPVTSGLKERTIDVMNSLASNTPGGINVTSAYRSPEINRAVGGAPSSLHVTGDAFDLSTRGLSDEQKRDLVERSVMSGGMEIGTYPDQSLHVSGFQRMSPTMTIDGEVVNQPTGGVTAMHNRSRNNYASAPDWFKEGLEVSRLAATPTPRPTEAGVSIAGGTGTIDFDRVNSFSPSDKRAMAMTLAGEIDPRYTDLNDPLGQREAFGILSTMENRVNKYGSVVDAITAPKQYSTWNDEEAANVARQNYAANAGLFDSIVDNYVSDPTKRSGFTSYYNPSIANPGWGPTMTQTEDIGPHRFGAVEGYNTGFGQNFGKTSMTEQTQQAAEETRSFGVGAQASATGSLNAGGWGATSANSSFGDSLGGFSSSVSGENANRTSDSMSSSGRDGSTGGGFGGDRSGSTGGFGSDTSSRGGGSNTGRSTGGGGFSSTHDNPGKSADDRDTGRTTSRDTYNDSKDSGFGGTGTTGSTGSTTHDNPGKSEDDRAY